MRRVLILAAALGVLVCASAAPARAAGVVDDLLAVLGLAPASSPSSPTSPPTDFRNCDTGECD